MLYRLAAALGAFVTAKVLMIRKGSRKDNSSRCEIGAYFEHRLSRIRVASLRVYKFDV